MAYISREWPICVFGTADNQDSIRLSAEMDEKDIRLLQQTLSGEGAEVMKTFCFQIDCGDSIMTDKVTHFLRAMDWKNGIAATSWQEADFLRRQDLIIEPKYRSHFCYVGLDTEVQTKDLLNSLNFSQKTILWTAFLKDGFELAEFEWFSEAISKDDLDNRMEWELSLRESMNQLHFKVINQNKDFEICDGTGQRRYFGADLRHPAERASDQLLRFII